MALSPKNFQRLIQAQNLLTASLTQVEKTHNIGAALALIQAIRREDLVESLREEDPMFLACEDFSD